MTGHWTQGVWAKTRYIGCGYAACSTGSPWGNQYANGQWFYTVCKYFPGGNYNGAYPYTEGTKCSDCDADRSTCEGSNGGLCGGDICLNCAADFFQNDCTYTASTCTDFVNDAQSDGEVIAEDTNADTDTNSDRGSGGNRDSDTDTNTDTNEDPDADQSGARPVVSYLWVIVPAFLVWK